MNILKSTSMWPFHWLLWTERNKIRDSSMVFKIRFLFQNYSWLRWLWHKIKITMKWTLYLIFSSFKIIPHPRCSLTVAKYLTQSYFCVQAAHIVLLALCWSFPQWGFCVVDWIGQWLHLKAPKFHLFNKHCHTLLHILCVANCHCTI